MCKQPRPFVLIDGLYLIINVNYTTSKVLFSDKLQRARQHSSILLIKSGFGLEYIHTLGSDKTWWMTILFEHWTRDSLLSMVLFAKLAWFSFLWHLHEAWQVTITEPHRLNNVTVVLRRGTLFKYKVRTMYSNLVWFFPIWNPHSWSLTIFEIVSSILLNNDDNAFLERHSHQIQNTFINHIWHVLYFVST